MTNGREPTTDEVGGQCSRDGRVAEVTDQGTRGGVCAYALDPGAAKARWGRAEGLFGESFPT
jgi:hypothetical protein